MLPLILTATLDEAAHRYFDELRRPHFPPDRNVLAAHLTLFHALAGECIAEVEEDISNTVQGIPVQPGNAAGLRSLGSGVAFVIECPGLVELRRDFAERWALSDAPRSPGLASARDRSEQGNARSRPGVAPRAAGEFHTVRLRNRRPGALVL